MTSRHWAAILLFLLPLSTVEARRARFQVPLMPPRSGELAMAEDAPTKLRTSLRPIAQWGVGVELGSVAIRNETAGNFTAAQWLWGGRVSAYYPLIGHTIFVKPSLGYFIRPDGKGSVGVTQHDAEAGLVVEYAHIPYKGMQWAVGLAQRADMLFSTIHAPDAASTSSLQWRYRVGPSVSIGKLVDRQMSIIGNIEGGMAFSQDTRVYGGLTIGIMYHFFE